MLLPPTPPYAPPPFTPTSKTIFRMLTHIFFLFLIPLLSRRLITAELQLASGDGGGGLWGETLSTGEGDVWK